MRSIGGGGVTMVLFSTSICWANAVGKRLANPRVGGFTEYACGEVYEMPWLLCERFLMVLFGFAAAEVGGLFEP